MTKKAKKPDSHPQKEQKHTHEQEEELALEDTATWVDEGGAVAVEPAADSEPPLEERLDAALAKAEENWNLLLRARADLENLRKRSQRDIENAHKYGLEKIANELLAVRDSMELGLGAAQENTDVQSLREGAELTLRILVQVMEKFGIQQLDPVHQKFNPQLHQAMTMQETNELEPNTVVTVMQKGYLLNDRLLRPALVVVAKAPRVPEQES